MAGLTLLDQLLLGDHICWTVDDDAVRRDALTALVEGGLRAGHRILYCGPGADEAVTAFDHRGPTAHAAVSSGALRFPSLASSYVRAEGFDPAAALRFLRREIDDAHREGYAGLRVISDMSWASRPVPGVERLADFEAAANAVYAEGFVLGVCAYDPRLFTAPRRRELAAAHPGTAGTGTPFDPARALRVRRTAQPVGLRLEGEADLANSRALSAVLDHLVDTVADPDATLTIDVHGLSFIDTAATRILVAAAERAAGRLRLVGHSPALDRMLELCGAGRSVVRACPERSAE